MEQMVSPINVSLRPNPRAIVSEQFTTICPPITIATRPPPINIRHFHTGRSLISSASTSSPACIDFFADSTIQYRKNAKIATRMIPSACPTVIPRNPIIPRMTAAKTEKGNSFFKVAFLITSGWNNAQTPQTTRRLNILDPITLLIAIPLLP